MRERLAFSVGFPSVCEGIRRFIIQIFGIAGVLPVKRWIGYICMGFPLRIRAVEKIHSKEAIIHLGAIVDEKEFGI